MTQLPVQGTSDGEKVRNSSPAVPRAGHAHHVNRREGLAGRIESSRFKKSIALAAKSTLDLILAAVGLMVTAPLWLLVAFAIRATGRGPILYRQRRWGRNGELFTLFKFRTMTSESDQRFGIRPADVEDERVTRVGRLLRATGMDELPQLLNILRGDMSLVGPRALAVGEVLTDESGREFRYEDYPDFRARLAVRPGLTGLATIYLPKDAPPPLKLAYDLRYIEQQSFLLDVKLIAMSIFISLRGRWETRERKL